jgi:hypothetical protein
MGKKMAMKIYIRQRFCLGHEVGYQVFELIMKATKHIEVEIFKRDWSEAATNSSNKDFSCCIYIATEASPF